MDTTAIEKVTAELQERYPDVGIRSIEVDETTGKSTFLLNQTPTTTKALAYLKPDAALTPHIGKERAASITRDVISRSVLDLGAKDPFDSDPTELFPRARRYYFSEPLVGGATDFLSSISAKGFEHDVDDPDVKNFFDTWAFDVNFEELIEWIFLEFFRSGNVYTYKAIAKYEPRVSNVSAAPGQKPKKVNKQKAQSRIKAIQEELIKEVAKVIEIAKEEGVGSKKLAEMEKAAKKNIWSKGHLPIAYTVLNPELVTVEGNLLFNASSIKITLPTELKEALGKDNSELSEDEKNLIKTLPADIKKSAEEGGDILLDSRLVGRINYRKQPYEKYSRPKTTRVFDAIEYKNSLRQADLSTLDGISNYILKITIGSDEYPVTQQAELEAVAQLFNTPSKSFDVVWNHTLQIEKIVSPEIESILGIDKYEQVNNDLTFGLGVSRGFIDGADVDVSSSEAALITKGMMEEISYARRQVTRWIENEYRLIAEAVGFETFPKIRWDEGVLKDTILYMSTLAQLVDRRMLSYQTALEALGFDYPNELENMTIEKPLVEDGTFGILGSPWQQTGVQPGQNAPKGTPSGGRPKAKPAKKKTPVTNPDKKVKQTTKNPKQTEAKVKFEEVVKGFSKEEYANFLDEVTKIRNNE